MEYYEKFNSNKYMNYNDIKELINDYFKTECDSQDSVIFDNFDKIIENLMNNITKFNSNKCMNYKSNEINIDDSIDNIQFIDIINSITCKNCGQFNKFHSPCNKFICSETDNNCKCGFSIYNHKSCDKYEFCADTEKCQNCGLKTDDHIEIMIQNKIYPCDNFIKSDNCTQECKNCIYKETQHLLSDKMISMNANSSIIIFSTITKLNQIIKKINENIDKNNIINMFIILDTGIKYKEIIDKTYRKQIY